MFYLWAGSSIFSCLNSSDEKSADRCTSEPPAFPLVLFLFSPVCVEVLLIRGILIGISSAAPAVEGVGRNERQWIGHRAWQNTIQLEADAVAVEMCIHFKFRWNFRLREAVEMTGANENFHTRREFG